LPFLINKKEFSIMEQTIFRKPAAHCFEHPAEMTETHEMVKIGG